MPQWDESAVMAAARRLRLAVDPRRRRHGSGSRLGAGPGASLEFHDYRSYVAGDDLRQLDWGVYARTDQLVLRRHRQEVSPRVEVVLDCSESMALTAAKAGLATSLAGLFATLAESEHLRPGIWLFADRVRRIAATRASAWRAELTAAGIAGSAGLEHRPPPFAPGSERIVVSDGLCPAGGTAAVRTLGCNAGRLCLVQVLTRSEIAPTALGPVRLEDVEQASAPIDIVHDDEVCASYRSRFARHQSEWQTALAGRGAGLVTCVVEDGFDAAVRALLDARVLEPRGG
jgi:uncharacterized protein (DUF58 family)